MKRNHILILITYLIAHMIMSACSSAPRKGEYLLHSILLYNLHYRRLETVGASPGAFVGEKEYESNPRPNAHYDCEPLKGLYKELNLAAVRECLNTSSAVIQYRLHRNAAPYLSLEEPENAPPCVVQLLSKIQVPREIFFQSNDTGTLSCYNARIPIVEEELLGIKDFFFKFNVKVSLPLDPAPSTDSEVQFLLSTWSVAPFFDEGGEKIKSRIVPSDICRACIGQKGLFLDTDSLPPVWP